MTCQNLPNLSILAQLKYLSKQLSPKMHFTGLRLWAEMTNVLLLNWKNAPFARKSFKMLQKSFIFRQFHSNPINDRKFIDHICLRTKVFWTIPPLGKESLFSNLDTLPFRLAIAWLLIKYVPTLLDCNERGDVEK